MSFLVAISDGDWGHVKKFGGLSLASGKMDKNMVWLLCQEGGDWMLRNPGEADEALLKLPTGSNICKVLPDESCAGKVLILLQDGKGEGDGYLRSDGSVLSHSQGSAKPTSWALELLFPCCLYDSKSTPVDPRGLMIGFKGKKATYYKYGKEKDLKLHSDWLMQLKSSDGYLGVGDDGAAELSSGCGQKFVLMPDGGGFHLRTKHQRTEKFLGKELSIAKFKAGDEDKALLKIKWDDDLVKLKTGEQSLVKERSELVWKKEEGLSFAVDYMKLKFLSLLMPAEGEKKYVGVSDTSLLAEEKLVPVVFEVEHQDDKTYLKHGGKYLGAGVKMGGDKDKKAVNFLVLSDKELKLRVGGQWVNSKMEGQSDEEEAAIFQLAY